MTEPTAESEAAAKPGWLALLKGRNAPFRISLAVALLLHAAPLLGLIPIVSSSLSPRMGERDGAPDALSVEVMDEAALAALTPPPPPLAPPPQQPPQQRPSIQPAMPPPPPQPPKPQPEAAQSPEPKSSDLAEPLPPAPAEAKAPPPPEAKTPPPPEKQPPQKQAELMKELVDLFAPDPAPRTPSQAKDSAQPARPQDANAPRSALDTPMEFEASASSVARPADITRSGENTEFGRNVIRALRETMPASYGLTGSVTIKFLLAENGQMAEMRLVRSSGYPILDQSIVLAATRSGFPVPPRGSKVNDRIFLVTYIYEPYERGRPAPRK